MAAIGPLGSLTNSPTIDCGTLCLHASPVPVTITAQAGGVSNWEKFRRSTVGQAVGGIAAGTGISFVPGGFLAAPIGQATGLLRPPSRTFQFFEGAGETATGFAQLLGGIGGEIGGAGLDALGVAGAPETFGASLGITAAGVAVNVASWGMVVQGAGNIVAGIENSAQALFMTGEYSLPEGGYSIVDHPDQTAGFGKASGPEMLGESLERAGEPKPSQYHEPHHIVPENDSRAARAREILEEAGIGVNDAENGIWLPRTSRGASSERGIPTDAFESHDSIHSKVYMEELTERLEMAGSPEEVRTQMQIIKYLIYNGAFPW